jgi:glycosyltransferase involved in cell wall biosynthesis
VSASDLLPHAARASAPLEMAGAQAVYDSDRKTTAIMVYESAIRRKPLSGDNTTRVNSRISVRMLRAGSAVPSDWTSRRTNLTRATTDAHQMNTAIVHEWFDSYAGSERVVEQILKIFPSADLFGVVDFIDRNEARFLNGRTVNTSFIQRLPGARRHFRNYLPMMPMAVEQFNLSDYDLIISSSHAVAKGVITRSDQLHVSYVHTPMRYAWELQHEYLREVTPNGGLKRLAISPLLHYLRIWDAVSAQRVDRFVANSQFIRDRIRKTYGRESQVIYPPVDVDKFDPTLKREDFYLTVGRWVPYKRLDLIVTAFGRLGLPLVVVGAGTQSKAARAIACPNIQLLGHQSDSSVQTLLETCKAFVFASEEDFGITVVEAQAAGAPVIAYGRGGARETIINERTGIWFEEQTVQSLCHAVERFEAHPFRLEKGELRRHVDTFSQESFRTSFRDFIDSAVREFRPGDAQLRQAAP